MASPSVAIDIQSRISAFEALSTKASTAISTPSLLDTPNSPPVSASLFPIAAATASPRSIKFESRSPSPSPPILGRKTSLIEFKDDWELDDGPVYNVTYATRSKGVNGTSSVPSLSGRPTLRHVSDPKLSSYTTQSTPLIHLESSPPKPKAFAPPLPPRKASYGSLKSVSNSSTSSLARSPSGPNMSLPPIPPRKKSDSLTVDGYSPGGKLGIAIPRGHAPASSISSFHSVSLSSDGGTDVGSLTSNQVATFPMDRELGLEGERADGGRDIDNVSLDSFENVPTVSPSVSSISMEWGDYTKRQPPKLPQRNKPPSHPLSPPSGTTTPALPPRISPPLLAKHPPPPPPPLRARPPPASNRSSLASTITSTSDQSSVISAATSRTSFSSVRPPFTPKAGSSALLSQQKLTRPTPIPPAVRARYEGVFAGNVLVQRRYEKERERRTLSPPPDRKMRQAAGWRGLSVDLITNSEAHTPQPLSPRDSIDEEVGPEYRLDGRAVALVWKSSRLDRAKLKEIWTECDPTGIGSLDRAAFIKGMWRIDEELRRAQLTRRLPTLTTTPKFTRRKPSKPILR